ncbi:MAG: hypothetical protein LWW85_15235, partial [Marinilabiliales bacterium]|nr:hypothetical protein [Marinilabiliales bacterium]
AGLDSIEFKLTHDQILKLGASPSIDFAISLFQPDKGKVIASVLKSSQLSIKIALRAPVNLAKQ